MYKKNILRIFVIVMIALTMNACAIHYGPYRSGYSRGYGGGYSGHHTPLYYGSGPSRRIQIFGDRNRHHEHHVDRHHDGGHHGGQRQIQRGGQSSYRSGGGGHHDGGHHGGQRQIQRGGQRPFQRGGNNHGGGHHDGGHGRHGFFGGKDYFLVSLFLSKNGIV